MVSLPLRHLLQQSLILLPLYLCLVLINSSFPQRVAALPSSCLLVWWPPLGDQPALQSWGHLIQPGESSALLEDVTLQGQSQGSGTAGCQCFTWQR